MCAIENWIGLRARSSSIFAFVALRVCQNFAIIALAEKCYSDRNEQKGQRSNRKHGGVENEAGAWKGVLLVRDTISVLMLISRQSGVDST